MEEQETLVLLCDMYANPAVIVSWEFNGTQLEHTAGQVIVTNDGFTSKLTVNKLDMDLHRGTYICETNSPKHGKQRRTFSVRVKGLFISLQSYLNCIFAFEFLHIDVLC